MADEKPFWQLIDINSSTWRATAEWLRKEEASSLETTGTPGLDMVKTEIARARLTVCRELLGLSKPPDPVEDNGGAPYSFGGQN